MSYKSSIKVNYSLKKTITKFETNKTFNPHIKYSRNSKITILVTFQKYIEQLNIASKATNMIPVTKA